MAVAGFGNPRIPAVSSRFSLGFPIEIPMFCGKTRLEPGGTGSPRAGHRSNSCSCSTGEWRAMEHG